MKCPLALLPKQRGITSFYCISTLGIRSHSEVIGSCVRSLAPHRDGVYERVSLVIHKQQHPWNHSFPMDWTTVSMHLIFRLGVAAKDFCDRMQLSRDSQKSSSAPLGNISWILHAALREGGLTVVSAPHRACYSGRRECSEQRQKNVIIDTWDTVWTV